MTQLLRLCTLLACLSLVACGDDDGGADSGTADTGTMDSGSDSGADAGSDAGSDAAADAPGDDAGGDAALDAPAMDAAVMCFPLSGPTPELPDAIPSELSDESPTWMRPTGETCPAGGVGDVSVPYDSVCYVNDTGADIDVLFEMLVGEEDLRPAVVIYDGNAIPADATQCAAVSSDLVIDSAEVSYTVPDGAMVTFVATVQEAGLGTFQFVITPE